VGTSLEAFARAAFEKRRSVIRLAPTPKQRDQSGPPFPVSGKIPRRLWKDFAIMTSPSTSDYAPHDVGGAPAWGVNDTPDMSAARVPPSGKQQVVIARQWRLPPSTYSETVWRHSASLRQAPPERTRISPIIVRLSRRQPPGPIPKERTLSISVVRRADAVRQGILRLRRPASCQRPQGPETVANAGRGATIPSSRRNDICPAVARSMPSQDDGYAVP